MLKACIACARKAGFEQMELEVVKDNTHALAMYKSFGFTGMLKKRNGEYQKLVSMRKEIKAKY